MGMLGSSCPGTESFVWGSAKKRKKNLAPGDERRVKVLMSCVLCAYNDDDYVSLMRNFLPRNMDYVLPYNILYWYYDTLVSIDVGTI